MYFAIVLKQQTSTFIYHEGYKSVVNKLLFGILAYVHITFISIRIYFINVFWCCYEAAVPVGFTHAIFKNLCTTDCR